MHRSAALILILLLASTTCARTAEPAASAGTPAELVQKATSELNAWKYRRAARTIRELEKSDPKNASLSLLKLRLAVRIGRFEDAARLAAGMPPGTAKKLPAEEGLKTGRALSAAGKPKIAREWILHAARRAGAVGADRYLDSLIALVAPRGGQGLVTRRFAAELASPVKERLEAARAYSAALEALGKARRKDFCLRLARYAAQRRLAELSEIEIPDIPGDIGPHLQLAWQAPVGVDEIPEHFALAGDRLLVASQPGGTALPGMPLVSRLRAFDPASGKVLWSVSFAPEEDPAPAGEPAYSSRIDGMVADAGRAYLLVKTNTTTRRGNSSQQKELSARLHAVSLADGKPVWKAKITRRSTRLHLAGKHVVSTGFRTVSAYNTADGQKSCSKEFMRTLSGSATAVAKGLVMPGWKEILCVDPANGNVVWRQPRPGGAGFARQCLSGTDSVVLGEKGTGVHGISAYDAASGSRKWSRSFIASPSSGELVLALSGNTLIAARGSALRALTADAGKNLWKTALPLPPGSKTCRLLSDESRVIWTAGSEIVQLSAASGTPLWWGSNVQKGLEPLAALSTAGRTMVYTLEGSSPRLLSAWRVRPPATRLGKQLLAGAAQLVSIARGIAAGGNHRAALGLLEIARSYAAPGVLDVDLAIFNLEVTAGGKSPSLESRGLLGAALARAAGPTSVRKTRRALSSIMDEAKAGPESKCVAAAGLMILGVRSGSKYLAQNSASWTGSRQRRDSILAACRMAGDSAAPVLIAGLASTDSTVRQLLIEKLGGYRGKKVEAALAKHLTDPSIEVRTSAAGGMVSLMGKRAVAPLTKAYKQEAHPFAKNKIRALLATLGAHPGVVRHNPRPVPRPVPRPAPTPTLTKQQALAKAGERGKVLWSKPDPEDKLLLWIAVEKKFVLLFRSTDGSLTGYDDFLKMVGRKDLTVNDLAYSPDSVWAATTRGAFIFDRRTRAWSQLVINLDFAMLEACIEKVEYDKGKVSFTVRNQGRYEQDLKTKRWRKL